MEILAHEKPIQEYVSTIERLKQQSADNPIFKTEIERLEKKLDQLRQKVYSELTPLQRVAICRHPQRPHSLDYIRALSNDFLELHGDRLVGDDQAVVGGLATIEGQKFVVMGQEKGSDTESRLKHNFGSLHPEGYRKALRLAEMAERFNLPILSLIDTAGAYPGLEAEKRGQAWAIAENLQRFSRLKTPIIVIIIGEGCSGGAIGMAVGDSIGMMQHAYYSVISPEGCASILWKDATKRDQAAMALKLNAEDMLEAGVIDSIIQEPLGGAHHDPQTAFENVKKFLLDEWQLLKILPPEVLVEKRYLKFRELGSPS